jgi:hypothetical protein
MRLATLHRAERTSVRGRLVCVRPSRRHPVPAGRLLVCPKHAAMYDEIDCDPGLLERNDDDEDDEDEREVR